MNDRIANALASTSFASFLGGLTLAQINEWLQAGAFIVAIISGICAARYYWKKSK